ncbi:hypothetical protein llap_2149 [Limosa lapponica baueri]|uniref:Uncharacterized protein n=1 Tax=Limosa lapponica baueri TaxID=1758121 RepID=A0A2I0UNA3_LIMLA|nr:hypothetical protein llap_2149 [Limosa lapponica baueri]
MNDGCTIGHKKMLEAGSDDGHRAGIESLRPPAPPFRNCECKGVNNSNGVFHSEISKGLAKGDEGCLPGSCGKSVP